MGADRRPEPGDGIPARLHAGGAAPRDLALSERIAPVLYPQRPTGGRALGEGNVASGVEAVVGRAHRGVHWHGTSAQLEPRGGRELAARRHADGHYDHRSLRARTSGPDLERAIDGHDLLDLRREIDVDA